MKIKQVYIGGWFQRTTLHLSEIYDFLRDGESQIDLDATKLRKLQRGLDIQSVDMIVHDLEYIQVNTNNDIHLKIFEDGLITLQSDSTSLDDLHRDISALTDYYEHQLSPAFSYLFSKGAPVPKELANIKTVYPYFVVVEKATSSQIDQLLFEFNQKKHFQVTKPNFEIHRGDKLYIINSKGASLTAIGRFIEEQVFLREFKGQLHRYLNLHRIIWERIAEVKERGHIQGHQIGDFSNKVEGYAKTINLIEARINQMSTYLKTREAITKHDSEISAFLEVIEYRYENLDNTLSYVQEIWGMTKNYVNSSLQLFNSLEAKATQNSVKNLTVVTSVGVGATLIGLVTEDKIPEISTFGFSYFLILVVIGYSADKAMKWFYRRKSYKISDTAYNKDIK